MGPGDLRQIVPNPMQTNGSRLQETFNDSSTKVQRKSNGSPTLGCRSLRHAGGMDLRSCAHCGKLLKHLPGHLCHHHARAEKRAMGGLWHPTCAPVFHLDRSQACAVTAKVIPGFVDGLAGGMLSRMRALISKHWPARGSRVRSWVVTIGALVTSVLWVDSCGSFKQDEFRCDEAAARLQHCCQPLPAQWPRVILVCSTQGCSTANSISWNEASSVCIRDSSCAALVEAGACQVTDWTGFDDACSAPLAACTDDGGLDNRGVDGGSVACLARLQMLCQVRGKLSCP